MILQSLDTASSFSNSQKSVLFTLLFFKCNFTGFSTKNVLNHFTKNKLSAFYAVNKNEAQLRQNSFLKERWMPIAST